MTRHRKRPTVMPEGASYGTARVCAGIQTLERPTGRTAELGAEPQVGTARMLAALDKGVTACPRGIPTVQDRVVQTALRTVLEPIFEHDFAPHSYGFRPGRGCKDALRRVDGLLKAGYIYVVDADLKSYFDTIPKDRLLTQVGQKVSDGRILRLVEA